MLLLLVNFQDICITTARNVFEGIFQVAINWNLIESLAFLFNLYSLLRQQQGFIEYNEWLLFRIESYNLFLHDTFSQAGKEALWTFRRAHLTSSFIFHGTVIKGNYKHKKTVPPLTPSGEREFVIYQAELCSGRRNDEMQSWLEEEASNISWKFQTQSRVLRVSFAVNFPFVFQVPATVNLIKSSFFCSLSQQRWELFIIISPSLEALKNISQTRRKCQQPSSLHSLWFRD